MYEEIENFLRTRDKQLYEELQRVHGPKNGQFAETSNITDP
jgi:hypothetical protein